MTTRGSSQRSPPERGEKGKSGRGWSVPDIVLLDPAAGPLTIGRGGQADIVLHSPRHPSMLSRVHATLWFDTSSQRWIIVDLEVHVLPQSPFQPISIPIFCCTYLYILLPLIFDIMFL